MVQSSRLPRGKRASHGLIERSVFLFTAAVGLAAEDNGVTVTHIRSDTLGKRKTKAR